MACDLGVRVHTHTFNQKKQLLPNPHVDYDCQMEINPQKAFATHIQMKSSALNSFTNFRFHSFFWKICYKYLQISFVLLFFHV